MDTAGFTPDQTARALAACDHRDGVYLDTVTEALDIPPKKTMMLLASLVTAGLLEKNVRRYRTTEAGRAVVPALGAIPQMS